MKKFKLLVCCEESQRVCTAFRERGWEAYSCDIEPCSGGHPEWHIQQDVLPLINGDCEFDTVDGEHHIIEGEWDLLICHPPCTYMSKAGARWMYPKAGVINPERLALALEAKEFFMQFIHAKCKYIAIENPRPLKVIKLPNPSQVIQPYEYGDPYSKATLLWNKNLPNLIPTEILSKHIPWMPSNTGAFSRGGKGSHGVAHNAKDGSKTFPGIAQAMADQWGSYIENNA